MNRQAQIELLEELRNTLIDIERQQQDKTLPHSDQQLLDQAWEDCTARMEELEEILELADQWRDATEYLEEEEPLVDRPPTPIPPDIVRLANAPPIPEEDEDEEMSTESDEAMELEDDRDDCRYCSGCMYCENNDGYDPLGEI